MPNIDLSILNQRQTPAFYADTLANRPAAGFVGRIFVSTDTFAFYRDNGTSWDLIGGPGTGTITGTGTNGTVALWTGTDTIGNSILTQSGSTVELKATAANDAVFNIDTTTGGVSRIEFQNGGNLRARAYFIESSNELVYGTYIAGGGVRFETDNNVTAIKIDSLQNSIFYGKIGVGTTTPGAALDVHSAVGGIAQLNQTVVTNNTTLNFLNSDAGLWRIGSFYNAGANDFGIFDVVGSGQPITIKKTTGQVLIGTSTVGSGKLVVASATGDNGVQIVGASAPSLRIDNAESGPTKRAGLGISTAANNFIQGSADRDFCMFNGSTTASPILFGIYDTTNVAEAARISAARNFIVGKTADSGERLQISGTASISGSALISKSLINSVDVGTIAAVGTSTVTIISAKTGTISLGATIVITGFENTNGGVIMITANIVGNWVNGTLNNFGLGTVVSNESLGANDYRGYGQLVPTVSQSGNNITITLTNLQLSSISRVSIAIIENSN